MATELRTGLALATEYESRCLPEIEKIRGRLQEERARIRADLNSSPSLIGATAYLKAREIAEEQSLLRERMELRQLDTIDKKAEQALFAHEAQIGNSFGKVLPRNAFQLREAYQAHEAARSAYNQAAAKYNERVLTRDRVERRSQIKEVADSLLARQDLFRRRLSQIEVELNDLRVTERRLYRLSRSLRSINDGQVETQRVQTVVGEISIPTRIKAREQTQTRTVRTKWALAQ